MAKRRDSLAEALAPAAGSGTSMDVLLQLTLPIVLILAFVVATDIESLQQDIGSMQLEYSALAEQNEDLEQTLQVLTKEMQDEQSGRLLQHLDITIIALQQQLLLRVTDEVIAEQRDVLALPAYAGALPTVDDLLQRRIEPRFAATSAALAGLFNGSRQFELSEYRLRAEIIDRFQQQIDSLFSAGRIPGYKRSELKKLSRENRLAFQARLRGRLEAIRSEAGETQLELILAWIASKASEQAIQSQSRSLWQAIQIGGDERRIEQDINAFVNLKTLALIRLLAELSVPLLDQTCLMATDRPCSS